jgi:hypothetical protein
VKAFHIRVTILAIAVSLATILQAALPLAAAPLPSSVQSKVDACLKSLTEAEAELDARNPDMAREPLRVAKARLDSIKEYQSESWDHPDVVAARNRHDAVEKRYNEAKDKAEASAGKAEEQLKKLEQFRDFVANAAYPEELVPSLAKYEAAKALLAEIAGAGTDVQLQGHSDYSMTKTKVEVFEKDREKVIDEFTATAKAYTAKNASRELSWMQSIDTRIAALEKLFPPDEPRLGQARTAAEDLKTFVKQEQMEKAAKVFMRPEKYKGKDANALRTLARKPLSAKDPAAKILKIKLVSSKWGPPEGGLQWTDTTRTSLEVRTTSYFSVEIAAKTGEETRLYRIYLYKDKVNGKLQPAKSYVVGSELMLEKNAK